jgi:hypothetical protein
MGSCLFRTYGLAGRGGGVDRRMPVAGRTCTFMGSWRAGRSERSD